MKRRIYAPHEVTMREKIIFSVLLVYCVALTLIGTDIYAPSMPSMAKYFGVNADAIQHTITMNLIGLTFMPFFFGFMADWKGRRFTVLFGLSVFTIGSIFCALSESLTFVYLGRLLQGSGGASIAVSGLASIRDLYNREEAAKVVAYQGIAISASPAFAPFIGGLIEVHLDWHWNFYVVLFLAALGLLLSFLYYFEIAQRHEQPKKTAKGSLMNFKKLLKSPRFLSLALIHPSLFSGMWCFITVSAFYFIEVLKLSPDVYGRFVMFSVFAYPLSTFILTRVVGKLGLERSVFLGVIISALGAFLLLVSYWMSPLDPYLIYSSQAVVILGMGFIFSPTISICISMHEGTAGAASALLSTFRMGGAVIGSYMATLFYDYTLFSTVVYILCTAVLALIFYLTHYKLVENKTQPMQS